MVCFLVDELMSLDEVTQSVDALVSEETQAGISKVQGRNAIYPGQFAPPGLASPSGTLNLNAYSHLSTTTLSKPEQHGHVGPAFPRVFPPPGLEQGTVTPERTPTRTVGVGAEATRIRVSSTTDSAKRTPLRAQDSKSKRPQLLQDEDFPALSSSRPDKVQNQTPAQPLIPTPKPTPAAKKGIEKVIDSAAMEADAVSPAAADLQMKSAGSQGQHGPAKTSTPLPETSKPAPQGTGVPGASSTFPPLPPPRATSPSPAQRSGARTLRVMSTPKTLESPALPSPVHSVASKAVSLTQRPDTPVSEMVSDTASVLSASVSLSRAGSPPPSKIGSAAVRNTTKSQQRKQRKEASKQETNTIAEPNKAEVEEHAPVIGRKKKQKKAKPAKAPSVQAPSVDSASAEAAATAEPMAPPPPSSSPRAKSTTTRTPSSGESHPKDKVTPPKKATKTESRSKEDQKAADKMLTPAPAPAPKSKQMGTAKPVSAQPIESENPADRQQFGPASVFAEIRDSLWTLQIEDLQIFRPVTSISVRPEMPKALHDTKLSRYCRDRACKCAEIQEEDLVALRAGRPVRKQFHVEGRRMLITPNGDCLRDMHPDEEDLFLALQAIVATTAEHPAAFVAPRHQPGSGAFSLIKGRAVPNGRPNIFPSSAQLTTQDPIGKLQREDALSYINQYVLPRLNLDATNMGLPKGVSPLRDAAAASLNALAPYFYGPDAAAGVGIYSAPDGGRSMTEYSSFSEAVPPADLNNLGAATSSKIVSTTLMKVEDAEARLAAARKETDKLEKELNALIKRNRRVLLGAAS
ncbi:general negative regulator of transcription subunit 4 [Moelleriella libera RCEF 2490]|uniref:General negative regulator of transcription subunit 4 n=1 Tax=Moelleriella libera RCEF 2490 TaxID=1081109 RepID=A0A168CN94_9HYPO|nr:general negative regulator of transcription subunit 4 [Moelleriella libera RCEF 2490]